MLDRRSNAMSLEPLDPASEPIRMEPPQLGEPCRVAGEDAPAWLAAGFAIIGTVIASVSVSAWQQSALGSPEVAPLPPAALVERPPQAQDELPAAPPPPVRDALIPLPQQPASDSPQPPPAAASAVAAAVIAEAAPAVTIPATATPAVSERSKAASAECFGPLSIGFARNSAQPNADDVRRSLEPLRRWRSAHGDAIISIEGHSDTTGTEDINVLLSYSRAKAVASQLKRDGMPAQQMTIRAAGASEAAGGATALASDRSALLRIAGVEDCGGVETATKGP